ncbi:MAG TPA: hypothetical protein DDZ80_19945 [Cyanobacteria bacterium UBA8803]|nr:hypothetical protein [Cyanobacteria bacterium UBA8803]
MKKNLTIFFVTSTVSIAALILLAQAEMVGQVTNSTENILNVRDTPNSWFAGKQLSETSDFNSEATDPFELMKLEGFGELKIGLTAAQVFELLGNPETRGEIRLWGADGLYHQDWYYPQQGITLNMASETPEERQAVVSITLMSPSQLKTRRGIGIVDSYTKVMQAYKEEEDRGMSIPYESFVAGSIYGGLIFSFENGSVNQIFIGAAAE